MCRDGHVQLYHSLLLVEERWPQSGTFLYSIAQEMYTFVILHDRLLLGVNKSYLFLTFDAQVNRSMKWRI